MQSKQGQQQNQIQGQKLIKEVTAETKINTKQEKTIRVGNLCLHKH